MQYHRVSYSMILTKTRICWSNWKGKKMKSNSLRRVAVHTMLGILILGDHQIPNSSSCNSPFSLVGEFWDLASWEEEEEEEEERRMAGFCSSSWEGESQVLEAAVFPGEICQLKDINCTLRVVMLWYWVLYYSWGLLMVYDQYGMVNFWWFETHKNAMEINVYLHFLR